MSNHVVADEYHYVNLLSGAKATGLGGAFTAVADDLTAMLYNPAGLSFSDTTTIASINMLSWEQTSFNEVFSDNSDFERESFMVVPSFFAFRYKEKQWDFGVSFAITDFAKERTSIDVIINVPPHDSMPAQTNNEFIYIDLDNSAYKFGASTAYLYQSNLSFGASLYFQYKEFTTVQGSGIAITQQTPNGNLEAGFNASRRITDQQISVQPVLGVLWHQDSLSLGGKLSQEILINRDYQVTASIFLSSLTSLPADVNPVTRITEVNHQRQQFPLEISLSASYQFKDFLLSADLNYFTQVAASHAAVEIIGTPVTRTLNEVLNWSVGFEYQFSKNTALRLGLFTDNSNGDIDTEINYQRVEDIDLLGFSSSIETDFIGNKVTFGFYYKQGRGDVRYADIRSVEAIVGLPLYPDNGNHDIAHAKKKSLVLFLSLNF